MKKISVFLAFMLTFLFSACSSSMFDKLVEAYESSTKELASASSNDDCDRIHDELMMHISLKSATYRVSWEFTCKTTKILLLYIFLGHNRNVADTKSPYPIKRLEVIRWFNQKSMVFNQSLS